MTEFAHDSIVPYKESALNKKQQVATMFNDIAFRYDFLNRFLRVAIFILAGGCIIKLVWPMQPMHWLVE